MNDYAKLPTSMLENPRVGLLSDRAHRLYINMWLYCAVNEKRNGKIDTDIRDLAWHFRFTAKELDNLTNELIEAGLLDVEYDEFVVYGFDNLNKDLRVSDNISGFVYLIRDEENPTQYKIGMSRDPKQRLKDLQTSTPSRLTLVHTIEADRPREAEKELHERFAHHRTAGEWFELSLAELEETKSYVAFIDGLFVYQTS